MSHRIVKLLGASIFLVGSVAHAQQAASPAPAPGADEAAPRALNALIQDEATSQRRARWFAGGSAMGLGAGFGLVGAFTLAFPDSLGSDRTVGQIAGGGALGLAGASILLGAIQLGVHTPLEDFADEYAKVIADPSRSPDERPSLGESKLQALADRERKTRVTTGGLQIAAGSLAAGVGITLATTTSWDPAVKWSYGVAIGTLGFVDVMLGVWSIVFRRDPAERLLRMWTLGTGRGQLTFAPQPGGGMLGLQATF